jgi:hypothetical protein
MRDGINGIPEYMTLTASGTDAICLVAVTVTHPTSSDMFAFLPGEIASVCSDWDPDNDYNWAYSDTPVYFEYQGEQQMSRPKCLWIDSIDANSQRSTKWKGMSVHFPDFKLDNSIFKSWERDPRQMCGAKARWGMWEEINEHCKSELFWNTKRISRWS